MTFAATLASLGSIATAPVGTAPGYMARAWVNFNGTGTVTIRASGNVSSITDVGVGTYTVNLTNAMPDTNYAVSAMVESWAVQANPATVSTITVIPFITTTGAAADRTTIQVAVFR